MLQEDRGLGSWRKKSHFGWPPAKLTVSIQVENRKESNSEMALPWTQGCFILLTNGFLLLHWLVLSWGKT